MSFSRIRMGCGLFVFLAIGACAFNNIYNSYNNRKQQLGLADEFSTPERKLADANLADGKLSDAQRNWAAVNIPELYEKYATFERSAEDVRLQIAQMETDAANDHETLRALQDSDDYADSQRRLARYAKELSRLKIGIIRSRAAALANSAAGETEADRIFAADKARAARADVAVEPERTLPLREITMTEKSSGNARLATALARILPGADFHKIKITHARKNGDMTARVTVGAPNTKFKYTVEVNTIGGYLTEESSRALVARATPEMLVSPPVEKFPQTGIDPASLFYAVRTRSLTHVRAFLELGANPNTLEKNAEMYTKTTPLAEAIIRGDLEIVEELLRRGADPNKHIVLSFFEGPPLAVAVNKYKKWRFTNGLAKGYEFEADDTKSPEQRAELIRLLTRYGADPSATFSTISRSVLYAKSKPTRNGDVRPLICHVLASANLEAAQALLAAGADVNARGKETKTGRLAEEINPWENIERGNPELFGAALASAPDPNSTWKFGRGNSLLTYVLEKENESYASPKKRDLWREAVKFLIELGADVNAPVNEKAPLFYASTWAAMRLIEAGADVHATSPDGSVADRFPGLRSLLQEKGVSTKISYED